MIKALPVNKPMVIGKLKPKPVIITASLPTHINHKSSPFESYHSFQICSNRYHSGFFYFLCHNKDNIR